MAERQEDALERLLLSGVPAMLEIGAALKSAQAWEVEAGLIYDDQAWFLYDELWELSSTARPELSPSERGSQIDQLLDPLLDAAVPDGDRAARWSRFPGGARGADGPAVLAYRGVGGRHLTGGRAEASVNAPGGGALPRRIRRPSGSPWRGAGPCRRDGRRGRPRPRAGNRAGTRSREACRPTG